MYWGSTALEDARKIDWGFMGWFFACFHHWKTIEYWG